MKEKRLAIRYPVDKLPENLKTFMVDILRGAAIEVATFDASSIGIGLVARVPSTSFSIYDHIVLNSVGDDFRLVGQIRYIHSKNDNSCQLGVEFKQSKSLNLYQSFLTGIEGTK